MKRVCVIGCSGSGKTTLGGEIAERTGLPQVSLDSIYWKSGWVQTSREEWRPIHAKLIAQDRWVMDGNFFHTLDARLAAADTVVFIDLPTLLCFYRVVKRTLQWWGGPARIWAPSATNASILPSFATFGVLTGFIGRFSSTV